jgi:ferritin
MIGKKMQKALNAQINEEFYSAYLYLSMSANFEAMNLSGFANWMRVQTQEEMVHAMKIFDYVLSRGGRVELKPLGGPQTEWQTALEAHEAGLKHEQHITECINNLSKLAREENDNASVIFLDWFVNEQVEEEKNADQVIKNLKLIGKDGPGLFMIDREMATRVFVPPAPASAA